MQTHYSRYLISCYDFADQQSSRERFTKWYAGEKNNHENLVKECSYQIHNDDVEKELSKHKEWRKRSNLVATPTILVNGFELPDEYEIEDLTMIVDGNFVKQ
ncbi:MAG: thioredoxin domain-containing protein [Bacteroidaceae bacterium]|nr:thioredoxin domain-containing protein [Bacteroidaceae bacterium]